MPDLGDQARGANLVPMHAHCPQELQLRWQEYYEVVTALLRWQRQHTVQFEERRFPASYEEVEVRPRCHRALAADERCCLSRCPGRGLAVAQLGTDPGVGWAHATASPCGAGNPRLAQPQPWCCFAPAVLGAGRSNGNRGTAHASTNWIPPSAKRVHPACPWGAVGLGGLGTSGGWALRWCRGRAAWRG